MIRKFRFLGEGTWRIRVPMSVIEAHCFDEHARWPTCAPFSLHPGCEDLLVQRAWEDRLSRQEGAPVRVVI